LADAVVSRAGAATVSELSALGIPAVYVPYAVGNGEQRLNAAGVVKAGGSLLVDDATFTGAVITELIVPLLSDAAGLQQMAEAAQSVGIRTGTENVLAQIARVAPN